MDDTAVKNLNVTAQIGIQTGINVTGMQSTPVARGPHKVTNEENLVMQSKARQMQLQLETQQWQQLNMSMLAVNMGMLGVTFGYQNLSKAMDASKTRELQELQLKKNKSKADEKRIEQIRKEQIAQQEYNTYFQAGISALQMALSLGQMYVLVQQMSRQASLQAATADAFNASVKAKLAGTTGAAAASELTLQTAQAGWMAPAKAAIMLAAILALVGTVATMVVPRFAAKGAVVDPRPGGSLWVAGEGGQREVITPERLMREIIREETRVVGGGASSQQVINIYANDAESFRDMFTRDNESIKITGVK